MTRSAGRIGDGAILLQGVAPEMLDRAIAWLDEGIAAAGRPPGSVEISCWVPFSYDINPAGARDRVRTRVASAVVQANPDWFKDDERLAIEAIKRDYDVADHAQAVAAHADLVPDSLVRKFAIAGDGEDIRIQLDALRRHPRLTRVILTPQASSDGTSSMADVLRQLGDITPLND